MNMATAAPARRRLPALALLAMLLAPVAALALAPQPRLQQRWRALQQQQQQQQRRRAVAGGAARRLAGTGAAAAVPPAPQSQQALVLPAAGDDARRRRLQGACDTGSFPPLSPTYLDSKVAGVEWAGADDQHVFVITSKNAVWRSKDGGSTFEDITERFTKSLGSDGAEPVAVTQILSHASEPSRVIFVNSGEHMWTSQDYGETLVPHKNSFKGAGSSLRPHPTKPDWLLAHAKRPGCKVLDEVEMRCAHDLLVSQNAFSAEMSWTNLTANAAGKVAGFVDWGWGTAACAKAGGGGCTGLNIPETSVFATMYAHAGDWDTAWDPDVHFVRSDDWFKTIKQTVPCGNQFELLGRQVYLAVSNKCPQDMSGKPRSVDPAAPPGITLHTSTDGGAAFRAACLPVALRQEGYELLETHDGDGAVVIVDYAVRTALGSLQASSAYTAGPHHALFSLSLSSIYKQDVLSSSTDFLRVDGVPGVFIANKLAITTMRGGDDGHHGGGGGGGGGVMVRPAVVSRITFNGGGEWAPLKAPKAFNHQACNRCGGDGDGCALHLHGASSWYFGSIQYPSAYSSPSAPGLLVGSGNVGPEGVGLDDNDGLCTWLSFDGGFSWTDIAEGSWIYEYADWGGLVVMTKHELNGPADEIRFSYDYGRCWRSVPLDVALYVENIRTEPDGQRPKVLLHGKACRRSAHPKCSLEQSDTRASTQGIVYALDVAQLMGSDKLPACDKTKDFETWTVPADDRTPRCLLGAQRKFTRRRQDATCLQGGDYARPPPDNATCACALSDVECDYGFVRSSSSSATPAPGQGEAAAATCVALPQEKLSHCAALDAGGYYVSSSGRRLVHGDVCTGLDKVIADTDGKGRLNPGSKPAPQPTGGGGGGSSGGGGGGGGGGSGSGSGGPTRAHGAFVLLVVCGVLVGVVGAWYHFLAPPAARTQLEDLAVEAKALATGAGALLLDLLVGLFGRAAALVSGRGGRGGGGGGGLGGLGIGVGLGAPASARYAPLDEEELNFFEPLGDAADAPPPPPRL